MKTVKVAFTAREVKDREEAIGKMGTEREECEVGGRETGAIVWQRRPKRSSL